MKSSGLNKKKIMILTAVIILIAGIFFINSQHASAPKNPNQAESESEPKRQAEAEEKLVPEENPALKENLAPEENPALKENLAPEENPALKENLAPVKNIKPAAKKILQAVPFAPQAPFGNWSDQRQQDGCEEASVLMAIKWARGESLNKEDALKEILAASDYILEKYGEYRDTDLNDVLTWIVKDYFAFEKAELRKNVSKEDLIAILEAGQVIAAPMNGQILKNPNFTPPGPINHMLLIRGYDPDKKKIITNDPGTRRGELYEYDEDLLFSALRAYPTGYHEPNNEERKNILVFYKQ